MATRTVSERKLRQAIREVLSSWEQYLANSNMRGYAVFDDKQNRYTLIGLDKPHGLQIGHSLIHLAIEDAKIYIEFDGTDKPVASELVAAGVPKEQIVLAFYPPEVREAGEFAVA